ncbi:hypothetical protein MC7420_1278 [Coleofasciculus chthonoplastes PCC 7420]|uniref:Uncharacterized protein n=1 Tax=Coleofasciculus chthonoplastes PCC 7420 TaxID=118168 RepID=B4VRN6_9CYAN|nr:hypothetical protein MC7420_1278 [Coleofasciculus chthonoplastes PCC 7420]
MTSAQSLDPPKFPMEQKAKQHLVSPMEQKVKQHLVSPFLRGTEGGSKWGVRGELLLSKGFSLKLTRIGTVVSL